MDSKESNLKDYDQVGSMKFKMMELKLSMLEEKAQKQTDILIIFQKALESMNKQFENYKLK